MTVLKLAKKPYVMAVSAFAGMLVLAGTASAQSAEVDESTAQNIQPQLASLSEGSAVFIDLVAADFFESRLRLSQSRKIEAATAKTYLAMSPENRAVFREQRRQLWRNMKDTDRKQLRGAKRPQFENLGQDQQDRFRTIAAFELGVATVGTANQQENEI